MSSEVPPIHLKELLVHAAWLRRLAVTLVGAANDADDLVQETWLRALLRPPRPERGAEDGGAAAREPPVRRWLAEVLRNAARMRRRSAARRARREWEVATDAPPERSAEALLERAQTQRLLAELVVELAEPYRSTLLLRYYEGLSAAEIARAQGVPAGTVRWRLKTGMDQLRAGLDRASGSDRRRWCVALLALALPREEWRAALPGAAGMSRALKMGGLVATLLVLPAAAYHCVGGRAPSVAAPAQVLPAGSAAAMAAPPRAPAHAPLPNAMNQRLAAVVEPDRALANGAFEGRVLDGVSGAEVAGAEVLFASGGAVTSVQSDAGGHFRFEPAWPGHFEIAMVSARGYLPFAQELGRSPIALVTRPGLRIRGITLYLTPAFDYRGVVLGPGGEPAPGAVATLLDAETCEQGLVPCDASFTADAQGQFVFQAADGAIVEARHAAYGRGRARLDAPAIIARRLEIRLRAKGAGAEGEAARVAGRIVDAEGMPVAGARVRAHGGAAEPIEAGPLRALAQATSDEGGRFAIEGLDAGEYTIVAASPGHAPATARGVRAGTADLTLQLHAGGALSGYVVSAVSGAPVPSFTVVILRQSGPLQTEVITTQSVIDAEGRFAIEGLDPGAYRVVGTAGGHAPSDEIEAAVAPPPAQGAPVEIELPAGGVVFGRVMSSQGGAPLAHARIWVEGRVGDGAAAVTESASAVAGADGAFELTGLSPGRHSILVGAHRHHLRLISGLAIEERKRLGPLAIDLMPTQEGDHPRLEVAGIGVYLKPDGDALRIERVVAGGGAGQAGLAVGDGIVAVDGARVTDLGFDGSLERIRGPEGSAVLLAIRKVDGLVLDLVVSRRRIQG